MKKKILLALIAIVAASGCSSPMTRERWRSMNADERLQSTRSANQAMKDFETEILRAKLRNYPRNP